MKPREVYVKRLNLYNYQDAWAMQERFFEQIISIKKINKSHSGNEQIETPDYLLFCEHNPVYTIGRSTKENEIFIKEEVMTSDKVPIYHVNRGGKITFHGPGQLVVYPILDLEKYFKDINKYLRFIEEVIILTLEEFNIESQRLDNLTGIWVRDKKNKDYKICSIGIRTSNWVTMHGFALNVNTDLKYFQNIIPCGLENKKITSMEKILKKKIELENVIYSIQNNIKKVFNMEFINLK